MAAVTVDEWREQHLPHFTAREDELKHHLRQEVQSAAETFGLAPDSFIITSRVKESKSAAKTAARRSMEYWKLPDWVGVRIACPTPEAAYHISVSLNTVAGWKPGNRFDYNLAPKLDGYRGIHVYGHFEVHEVDMLQINCELQVHTRLQALWSELTHDDIYKSNAISILAQDTATNLAAYMAATDQLIERLLNILKQPEAQMLPHDAAAPSMWIAILSELDPSLDRNGIERVRATVEARGLKTPSHLQRLRERFRRSRSMVKKEWLAVDCSEPSPPQCIDIVARLIGENVHHATEALKLRQWAREANQSTDDENDASPMEGDRV